VTSIIFTVGIVIMGVSYSKEVLLVGRYVTSIIFPVVKVIIGVRNSKEVLLVGSLLQRSPPCGRYAASIIFPMGIVIMGVSYFKEVIPVGRYVASIIWGCSHHRGVLLQLGFLVGRYPTFVRFSVGIVFMGVSNSKKVFRLHHLQYTMGKVIMGELFSKEVLLVGRCVTYSNVKPTFF
jgi:hypothetical protein